MSREIIGGIIGIAMAIGLALFMAYDHDCNKVERRLRDMNTGPKWRGQ